MNEGMKQIELGSLILAIFFLLYPHVSLCNQQNVSITVMPSTSLNISCNMDQCLTLEDLVTASNMLQNFSENTFLEITLLQGNHSLSSMLTLTNIKKLALLSNNNQTSIKCEHTGRLVLENIQNVELLSLTFVSCTENRFKSVREFSVKGCTLISPVEDGTMLSIINSSGNFTKCSFLSCSLTKEWLPQCCNETSHLSVPGPILMSVTSSNVSIHKTAFKSEANSAIVISANASRMDITKSMFCSPTTTPRNKNRHGILSLIKTRFSNVTMYETIVTNIKHPVITNARYTNITIVNSIFSNNTGVFYFGKSRVTINNTSMTNNSGRWRSTMIYIFNSFCFISNGNISNNSGSFVIKHSYVRFSGKTIISKNLQQYDESKSNSPQPESTVTVVQSTVMFYGTTVFIENRSKKSGGAIHALGGDIVIYGHLMIVNNTAGISGGGAYLYLVDFTCYGNCTIIGNKANRMGGGLHVISTAISLRKGEEKARKSTHLIFANNEAISGGGLYFEVDSHMTGLDGGDSDYYYVISFINNTAIENGGAIFVKDETYSGVCASESFTHYRTTTECFFQTYENDHEYHHKHNTLHHHLNFSNNSAAKASILYGGLLDRCTLNLVAEIYTYYGHNHAIDGLTFFMNESRLTTTEEIASDAVRICFCRKYDSVPNCSYQPLLINVTKGGNFNITLAAVDQVNRSINASIFAVPSSECTLAEGQQLQMSYLTCTNVTYAISSPNNWATLHLYAKEGPCLNKGLSTRRININFDECTCPLGFEQYADVTNKCKCICHRMLQTCMSECKNGLLRRQDNCWVGHDEKKGYLFHANCPYDYCTSPTDHNSTINLRDRHGSDAQCAYGRSGLLCGACQPGFSLSMGTTHCIKCPSYWRAILLINILVGVFSGLIILIILFGFNVTVATGTINGLIFYANIVLALNRTFLPFVHPNFFTVFISMLNSEFRLERCLYNGVDAYAKVWLSLLLPLYLITLVLVITVASKYSLKCTNIIGKRNPVAVLATLILLSYTSILQKIIDIFSSIVIRYSDGSHEKLWHIDPTINYLQGKHIPLFLIALFFATVGLVYTVLLFSWQWLLRAPDVKIFRWIRNTKLNSFMDAHHAPYNQKYRFWTGFLLLLRIVVHFTLVVNESGKSQYDLLVVGIVMAIILTVKSCLADQLYRKSALDLIEFLFHFNLLLLTLASYFLLTSSRTHQQIVAKISVAITFITFMGILSYHAYLILSNVTCCSTVKQRVQDCLRQGRLNRDNYSFKFTRKSVRSKPTSTEVGLSDAVTEEEEGVVIASKTSNVRTFAGHFFNLSQRNQNFQLNPPRSYNSVYLRESLLLDQ